MEDTDLIARLYPDKDSTYAIDMIKNHPHCIHPKRRTRGLEPTEPPESEDNDFDRLPRLELRFSNIPRTSSGLVFGRDPDTCDVVLPNIPGISRRHFALTFKNTFVDGLYRLIVRDLAPNMGPWSPTMVMEPMPEAPSTGTLTGLPSLIWPTKLLCSRTTASGSRSSSLTTTKLRLRTSVTSNDSARERQARNLNGLWL
ncbi:hypothetical protein VTK56DRAFT_8926 [Thermocarpiscus australiensis]